MQRKQRHNIKHNRRMIRKISILNTDIVNGKLGMAKYMFRLIDMLNKPKFVQDMAEILAQGSTWITDMNVKIRSASGHIMIHIVTDSSKIPRVAEGLSQLQCE